MTDKQADYSDYQVQPLEDPDGAQLHINPDTGRAYADYQVTASSGLPKLEGTGGGMGGSMPHPAIAHRVQQIRRPQIRRPTPEELMRAADQMEAQMAKEWQGRLAEGAFVKPGY